MKPGILYQQSDAFHSSWTAHYDQPVTYSFSLDSACFIDRILFTTPADTDLTAVVLSIDGQITDRYTAETHASIRQHEIVLTAGIYGQHITLQLTAPFSDVTLLQLQVYGSSRDFLYPTPSSMELTGTFVPLASYMTFSSDDPEGMQAGEILAEKLLEFYNLQLRPSGQGSIRYTRDSIIPADGYVLDITNDHISISASNLRGAVYAAETLLKLIQDGNIPLGHIEDAPFCAFRGVHLGLPPVDQIPFTKRFIKYLLSPMGYNAVILEIAGGMQFDSHPEINTAFVEAAAKSKSGEWPPLAHDYIAGGGIVPKQDVAELADYIRSFGMDVIPEIQSLGHVQYLTTAHPEIAELETRDIDNDAIDTRLEDANKEIFYPHCFCPSDERSYQLLFDIADEIIETIRPTQYVHMGHDEVYQIGLCPKCREKDPADLYAEDINRLHEYLAKKDLKMMIWSDMLQPVSSYKTPPAIHKIPKDILMMDFIWYFHLDKDIETYLLDQGFKVIFGNQYSSLFPRYESRIRPQGVLGGEVSTWTETSEYAMAKEGKMYDILYSAQMLWSSSYSRHLRLTYDQKIRTFIPAIRSSLHEMPTPSLRKDALLTPFCKSTDSQPLPEYTINGYCESLIFSHTAAKSRTRIPWIALEEIGYYEVLYEDSTSIRIPIEYAGNIGYIHRRQNEPLTIPYYRHNGYIGTYRADVTETFTPEGLIETYYHYEWINPKPDCKICKILLHADSDVILAGIKGVNLQ